MELKDKLNLLWKFLFLAVFTYGFEDVYSLNGGYEHWKTLDI